MTQPTTPPPTDHAPHCMKTPPHHAPQCIGDELALRAGVDPAWERVFTVWLDGAAMYPQPFRNR